MRSVFVALLPALLFTHSLLAQTPAGTRPTASPVPATILRSLKADSVLTEVEQMPELPSGGGKAGIVAAIQRAIRFPSLALRSHIVGWVEVRFVVEPSGQVSNVAVVRGLGSGLDEETVRAVKALPLLHPGKQGGQAVRVGYQLRIFWDI